MIGCALHMNELPLRALFQVLDGKTNSATGFVGPIGKQLGKGLKEKPVVQFDPIPCTLDDMPEEVEKDLSSDQVLLRLYMKAISSGCLDAKTACRQIGPICHSRWLTLAIRILSLYCRTLQPSPELIILVTFIMKCYGKYWFKYKQQSSFLPGPEILFELAKDCQMVDSLFKDRGIWTAVEAVLQRNAFCCYGENFLVSLLFSDNDDHRNIAVDSILAIRSKDAPQVKGVKLPKIDFKAESWDRMVDIAGFLSDTHSPPCLKHVSDEELNGMRDSKLAIPPPDYPIHSQSVERCVKLVSAATKKAYSWEKQHQHILATAKSRSVRREFSSKIHYKIIE